MSNAEEFFIDDVVCRVTKKKFRFGFVLETYTTSDGGLQMGELLVLWSDSSDNQPQVCLQSAVKLLCRHLCPGDVVSKIENGVEIRGLCRSVNAHVAVRIQGTHLVIADVDAKRLEYIQPFVQQTLVSHLLRFGVITSCDFKIVLSSMCGSVVEFRHQLNEHIGQQNIPIAHRKLPEHYNLGHSIFLRPSSLVAPVWHRKSARIKRRFHYQLRFTVIDVRVCSVSLFIEVGTDGLTQYIVPEEEIPNLEVVWTPKDQIPRIGAWRSLTVESTDVVMTRKQWERCQMRRFRRISSRNPEDDERPPTAATMKKLLKNPKLAVEVLHVDAKADVMWQDGSAHDVPTINLSYPISLDEHAFLPGEWVTQEDGWYLGVIQKVITTDRVAEIKWYNDNSEDESDPQLMEVNEMSVYDVRKLEFGNYQLGEIVRNDCIAGRNIGIVVGHELDGHIAVMLLNGSTDKWWSHLVSLVIDESLVRHATDAEEENTDEYDNVNNAVGEDDSELSWDTESEDTEHDISWQELAGQVDFIRKRLLLLKNAIAGCPNLEYTSTIFRSLLYVHTNCSGLNKLLEASIFNMESERYLNLLERIKRKLENWDEKMAEDDQAMCGALVAEKRDYCLVTDIVQLLEECINLAYAGIMKKIAADEAGLRGSEMQTDDEWLATIANGVQPVTPVTSLMIDAPSQPSDGNVKTKSSSAEQTGSSETASFLICDEAGSAHRFYEQQVKILNNQRFFRAMMTEDKLLRECLPPGIWVCSFADRLDLFTAMIRGPEKTPYEDGLFIFDLQLVEDYPRTPPQCSYISYSSEQLNPNLYVEGRVCISLLGTWSGRGTEVWGPNSNLLQLLVSIQGLILVAEPYYNEAGYDKQYSSHEGSENSRSYNENVILRLVQSLTEMVLRPNNVFKARIFKHFQQFGAQMLKRLRDWLKDEVVHEPAFPLLPLSKGLKLSLKRALDQFERILIDTNCIIGSVET